MASVRVPKGLSAEASKTLMKSTLILLGSSLLEEVSLSVFKSQAWSLGKRLTNNDGGKEFPFVRHQLTCFPMDSGLALKSRWIGE